MRLHRFKKECQKLYGTGHRSQLTAKATKPFVKEEIQYFEKSKRREATPYPYRKS